jgi:3-oxoacyl-[acyl-carrier protein] reductase
MNNSTSNKLILITGASGGIGVAMTQSLLAAGWRNIVCQYKTRQSSIAAVLVEHGIDHEKRLICADLTDEDQVADVHSKIHEAFGPVYGLVNLAGNTSNQLSWKLSKHEFQEVLDANLLSTFLVCREFTPDMRDQHCGRVINVSSVVAFTGAPGASHYCAAKAAIVGFSKSLALELAPRNIAVSVVALGYFEYGMIQTISTELQDQIRAKIPARRFGTAPELSALVSYLLSESGAYSCGQVYHLNGGLYS